MSFTINRQQQFKDQPENEISTWIYALYSDVNGDYIKKPITECSGNEICQEWLYHLGVSTDKIEDLAKHASTYDSCLYAIYHILFHDACYRRQTFQSSRINLRT
ncbi:oleate hydratase [Staphylococcus aureus]|nr:oleate hydratase [Staphylococcus aureus]